MKGNIVDEHNNIFAFLPINNFHSIDSMDSAVLICLFVTLVMVLSSAANGESKMPITMDVMPNQRQPLRAETTQFVDAKSLPSNIGDIRPTDRVIDGGVEEVVDVVPPSGERYANLMR